MQLSGLSSFHPAAIHLSRRHLFAILFAISCWGIGCSSIKDTNTVVMLIESAPLNLDPRIGTDAQSARIGELIFDSLLVRDVNSRLQPSVASSWESPDSLTYIFHLRTDVRFHNGQRLTSRDVAYTIRSMLSGELKTAKAGSFKRIESVEVPDEFTIILRLKEPYASFPWNLTQGAFGIVPDGAGNDVGEEPIGSGPFRFVTSVRDEFVRLERNPSYWGGSPILEQVEFKVVPDATTRALELRSGSADIVLNGLPADSVESLRRDPNLQVTQVPGNTYQYIGLNLANPKLSLPVRQAIAHGIDRRQLIHHLWRELVQPANSVLPKGHWAQAADLPEIGYDPARSRGLLEAAGYIEDAQGVRLELVLKTSTDQAGREMAAVLQDQLGNIGIRLRIVSSEFATYYADITKGNFDLFSLRWIGGNEDPDIFEYVFHSKSLPPSGANRGRFSNQQADRIIEAARTATTHEQRRLRYAELQQLLNAELPYIHLWYLDAVAVHSRRLEGIRLRPDGSFLFLREMALR